MRFYVFKKFLENLKILEDLGRILCRKLVQIYLSILSINRSQIHGLWAFASVLKRWRKWQKCRFSLKFGTDLLEIGIFGVWYQSEFVLKRDCESLWSFGQECIAKPLMCSTRTLTGLTFLVGRIFKFMMAIFEFLS